MVVDTRVYFSNVSYASSEDDLKEYLKDFNVNSVLIPSQTVRRLHRLQTRSFGIAYADFVSVDDARRVIEECNGKEFKGRVLRVKPFNPYKPPKPIRERVESTLQQIRKFTGYDEYMQSASNNNQPVTVVEVANNETTNNVVTTIPEDGDQEIQSSPVEIEQQQQQQLVPKQQIPPRDKTLSVNTIYCAFLPKDTTDPELREYFSEFLPREIWIFRTKSINSGPFKLRSTNHTAALVTVTSGTPLQEVIDSLQSKKFMNKKITLKPAYLSKIEEVKQVADKSRIISVENGGVGSAESEQHAQQTQEQLEHNGDGNPQDSDVPADPIPVVDPSSDAPVAIQPVNDEPVTTQPCAANQNQNQAKKKNKKKKKKNSVEPKPLS